MSNVTLPETRDLTVAVVTGGHSFDVPHFHELFRSLPGITADIQYMEDFASSPRDVRFGYDVVLFYTMLLETPSDEGLPWYAGKPLTALNELGETEQGIVVLHHSLLAFENWAPWSQMIGIENRAFISYHPKQTVTSQIASSSHPITEDIASWTMQDETYLMTEAQDDNTILLTYDHPQSMRSIAWTRTYRNSRVFCY